MVVVPNHLALVERHVYLAVYSGERVAIERCALCGQLGVGAEEVRVVRHVNHTSELNIPRIFSCYFIIQNGGVAINLSRKLCVTACAEYRACLGVGVKTCKVARLQSIYATRVKQMVKACQIETTTYSTRLCLGFACCDKAELKHSMNVK